MSVAYAYDNGWDIGARACGGRIMASSQPHSCDSPTFRSKQQQDTMIRGLSASISLYINNQPESCKSSETRVVDPLSRLPTSPSSKDSCLASLGSSQDVSSRSGSENAQAHTSSQGSASTSSLDAFDDTPSLDTLDRAFLAHHPASFVTTFPSSKDSDTDGDEQPPDLVALVPDHSSRPASPASSVTSSIGEQAEDTCSSSSEDEEASGNGMEAESKYRGPLDQLSELESSLPIKRGLSRFFTGKSRSFTSLAEVNRISDVQELAKVENPFNRKRKMFGGSGGHHRCFPPLPSGAGVAKRTTASSRTTLALAVSMIEEEQGHSPPAYRRGNPATITASAPRSPGPFRSFSLTDLTGKSGQPLTLRRA